MLTQVRGLKIHAQSRESGVIHLIVHADQRRCLQATALRWVKSTGLRLYSGQEKQAVEVDRDTNISKAPPVMADSPERRAIPSQPNQRELLPLRFLQEA